MSEEICKCGFCGKKGIEVCFLSSYERSIKYLDKYKLWKIRKSKIGFNGWIIIYKKCLKLLENIIIVGIKRLKKIMRSMNNILSDRNE